LSSQAHSETTPDDRGTALRRATATDVPRLTELVRSAYGHYVDRIGARPRPMTDDYADVVRTHQVIVALRGGEVVGLIVLRVDADGFLVDNVAVDPAYQGTGVGKVLLEFAETAARDAGFDSIHLYTHERMTENLALYSRIGYVEYDRRRVGAAGLVYLRKNVR
jgi:ribosomal protein S18 acetylase RimI-like enzyme